MNAKEKIDSYNRRLEEIKSRKMEIESEIDVMTDMDALEARKKEAMSLVSEEAEMIRKRDAAIMEYHEDAKKMMNEGDKPDQRKENKMMNRRQSQLLLVGCGFRNKSISDEQMRALDTSLTTTAKTYVAATASANGVNNGGVFIPTLVLLDILREDNALTPILNDIVATSVAGLVNLPYRMTRTKAYNKAEGKAVNDAQWQWGTLALAVGRLQTQMVITDEVEEMTDMDFGAYLVSQLEDDMAEDWSAKVIYGTGASNEIAGITNGLTAVEFSDATTGIETIIGKLKGKYRRNAKLYVAQDVFDELSFAKDKNGRYLLEPINNVSGLQSIFQTPVAVDDTLNSGEIVYGCVARNYKLNFTAPMRIEPERHAAEGTTIYVCSQGGAGRAVPGTFAWGKKKTTTA